MYFGRAITPERFKDVSEWAVLKEFTIEDALIYCFNELAYYNSKKNEEGLCFYDYLFSERMPIEVFAPEIYSKTYIDGGVLLPMLVISSDAMVARASDELIYLPDANIDYIGSRFESMYGYEYFACTKLRINH